MLLILVVSLVVSFPDCIFHIPYSQSYIVSFPNRGSDRDRWKGRGTEVQGQEQKDRRDRRKGTGTGTGDREGLRQRDKSRDTFLMPSWWKVANLSDFVQKKGNENITNPESSIFFWAQKIGWPCAVAAAALMPLDAAYLVKIGHHFFILCSIPRTWPFTNTVCVCFYWRNCSAKL